MPDAAMSATTEPDAEQLDALSRELSEAADSVGEAARYASGLALGARLPATALARGGPSRLAWRTLLRTLTDPAGLGWAPRGRGVAGAGRFAGTLGGRESLAVSVAVCGLRTRIRAASAARPELFDDPDGAAVLRAAGAGHQAEAARLFRALVRDRGPGPAFALLTPSFADILAWDALTDSNPFNDHEGWQIATGRAMTAEPLLGLGAALRTLWERDRPAGPGDPPAPTGTRRGAGGRRRPGPAGRRIGRPARPGPPVGGLRGHAALLRSHARRLRATAAARPGSALADLRAEVAVLADRCARAAGGFALAAAQLDQERRPGRG